MIGVDWGTTSFRAYRIAADGTVRDRRQSARGIMAVQDAHFANTLREEIGPWLAGGENKVLLAGMVGSRQGWIEAPYVPAPAGAAEIAAASVAVPFEWANVRLLPGVSAMAASGVPEVMRGEETQILGVPALLEHGGVACLPGTHSKWVRVEPGRIAGFATHLTGEAFSALRGHTILGRTMRDGPMSMAAFEDGVRRSADSGGVLHHVFGARTRALFGLLEEADGASYLSGVLIGHEVRAAMPPGARVRLIGSNELTGLYATAIRMCGGSPVPCDADVAAVGLRAIADRVAW